MPHPPLFFSIIVPTYNRPDRLRQCLEALAHLAYARDRFEVIVVDDGSTMPLEPLIEAVRPRLDVTLLRQANAGPASARNAGAARSRGTFLAFTDDDCMPQPGWLTAFARRLAEHPDHMVGGRTVNALTGNPFAAASQRLIDYLYTYYDAAAGRAAFFTSNNMALPKARFESLGGFDTTFPRAAGEDRALCDRWLHAGYEMTYAPEAEVLHAHNLNGRTFWRQHFNYGRAAYTFHQQRMQRGQRRLTPEPLRFYTDLLRYPFEVNDASGAWREALLLGVSQVANAMGFAWEKTHARLTKS